MEDFSFSADQLPEDCWEQRVQYSEKLGVLLWKMKESELYPDVTINSLTIATAAFFIEHFRVDEDLAIIDYYCETLKRTINERKENDGKI